MKRREFIGALAVTICSITRAFAQIRPRKIIVYSGLRELNQEDQFAAFEQVVRQLAKRRNANVQIEYMFAANSASVSEDEIAKLKSFAPDVIFALPALHVSSLARHFSTVPIIFAYASEPVSFGLVESTARPGKNITGYTAFDLTISAKWAELAKLVQPELSEIVVLTGGGPNRERLMKNVAQVASAYDISLRQVTIDAANISSTLENLETLQKSVLIVFPDATTVNFRMKIFEFATRKRVIAIYGFRHLAQSGGAIAYGPSNREIFEGCASYVDRVLQGEAVSELPVQEPRRFELTLNLKAIREARIALPPSFSALADEVIE